MENVSSQNAENCPMIQILIRAQGTVRHFTFSNHQSLKVIKQAHRSWRRSCAGGKVRFTTKKYVVEFEIAGSMPVVVRRCTLCCEEEVAMSGFPDFNGDGRVDGRDYFIWNELSNGGSNGAPPRRKQWLRMRNGAYALACGRCGFRCGKALWPVTAPATRTDERQKLYPSVLGEVH